MATQQAQSLATHTPTVLVIEDSPDQWFFIEWAFRRAFTAVEPIWIADPAHAMNYVERGEQDGEPLPKLILLDAYLPRFEQSQRILIRLKAHPRYRSIPVLMLTSSHHQQDVQDCYANGCSSYFIKPTSFSRWQDLLAKLRHYWRGIAQLPDP